MISLLKKGDRVVIGPTCSLAARYTGLAGSVASVDPHFDGAMIILDNEKGRPRFFYFTSLTTENVIVNIKNEIKTAITVLFPKTGAGLNALARELLVATSAASVADARKKKAKDEAVKGGLVLAEYRPGEVTSFDDKEFTVVAKTKEPTSKLDQSRLRELLNQAGLSRAKIDAAFVGATTENKPATSYEVIQK